MGSISFIKSEKALLVKFAPLTERLDEYFDNCNNLFTFIVYVDSILIILILYDFHSYN